MWTDIIATDIYLSSFQIWKKLKNYLNLYAIFPFTILPETTHRTGTRLFPYLINRIKILFPVFQHPFPQKRKGNSSERRAWKSREGLLVSKTKEEFFIEDSHASRISVPFLETGSPDLHLSAARHYNMFVPVVNVGCFQRRWDVIGKIRSYDNGFRVSIIPSPRPASPVSFVRSRETSRMLRSSNAPDTSLLGHRR